MKHTHTKTTTMPRAARVIYTVFRRMLSVRAYAMWLEAIQRMVGSSRLKRRLLAVGLSQILENHVDAVDNRTANVIRDIHVRVASSSLRHRSPLPAEDALVLVGGGCSHSHGHSPSPRSHNSSHSYSHRSRSSTYILTVGVGILGCVRSKTHRRTSMASSANSSRSDGAKARRSSDASSPGRAATAREHPPPLR